MNVILDLDKSYLDKFQELADQDRRSRKNFMESVLINYLNGNPPTMERQNVSREIKSVSQSKTELPPQVAALAKGIVEINTIMPKEDIEKRIKELEAELKSPPKSPIIGQKKWVAVREMELSALKNQQASNKLNP